MRREPLVTQSAVYIGNMRTHTHVLASYNKTWHNPLRTAKFYAYCIRFAELTSDVAECVKLTPDDAYKTMEGY